MKKPHGFSKLQLIVFAAGAGLFALLIVIGLIGVAVGDGKVEVLVPAGRKIEVTANGQKLELAPGEDGYASASLPQAKYAIEIKDVAKGTTYKHDVEIASGVDHFMLPIDAQQCFVVLDPTEAVYEKKNERSKKEMPEPKILSRHEATKPFEVESGVYRNPEKFPNKIEENQNVELLTSVPCSLLKANDKVLGLTALLAFAGDEEMAPVEEVEEAAAEGSADAGEAVAEEVP